MIAKPTLKVVQLPYSIKTFTSDTRAMISVDIEVKGSAPVNSTIKDCYSVPVTFKNSSSGGNL